MGEYKKTLISKITLSYECQKNLRQQLQEIDEENKDDWDGSRNLSTAYVRLEFRASSIFPKISVRLIDWVVSPNRFRFHGFFSAKHCPEIAKFVFGENYDEEARIWVYGDSQLDQLEAVRMGEDPHAVLPN